MYSTLALLALAAHNANAMLRFPCSQLVAERFDPLLNPGEVSPHFHQIVGGNAFNITMDPNNDLPALSTCTSCQFKEDASNYWTAVLFFKHPNGTMKQVPRMANQFVGNPKGGMTVYYVQPNGNGKTTAFKKGFRMIVGDAMTRKTDPNSMEYKALTFRCWDANFGGNSGHPHPGTGTDTHELPKKACAGGIRSNIFFPTCWDGVNLDTPDHKSHVAYPTKYKNGPLGAETLLAADWTCPDSHPVRIPQLFLETAWDTREFNKMFPTDGTQPFVYSMGDPTGNGQHADYVFGWKGDSLQQAMDRCTSNGGGACAALTQQSDATINACTQKVRVDEPVEGWLSTLPGCNPIQNGPERAIPNSGCGAPTNYLP